MLKKLLIVGSTGLIAVAFATSASAANLGAYLGANVGWSKMRADTHVNDTDGDTFTASNTSGVGYGLDLGYNFIQYFGVQGDVTRYHPMKYNVTGTSPTTVTLKAYAADIMAMGYLPVADGFDLVGGLGGAYVRAKAADPDNGSKHNFYRPKALLGVDWQIDSNWSVNASYSRIFGRSSLSSDLNGGRAYLPNLDYAAIGFNYSFGPF